MSIITLCASLYAVREEEKKKSRRIFMFYFTHERIAHKQAIIMHIRMKPRLL